MASRQEPAEDGGQRPRQETRGAAAPLAALTCESAFRRLATACLAEIAANQHASSRGEADAIHRMRVGITRLRAAVSFFSPMTTDETWPQLKEELRWLNRSLGSARDVDVVKNSLDRKRFRKVAVKGIERELDRRSQRSHLQLRRALRSERFRRLVGAASDWIDRGRWVNRSASSAQRLRDAPIGPYCEKRIAQWRRKLVRRGSNLADMKQERRHRLRIRAKRLRYMLEMLTTVCPDQYLSPFSKVAKPIRQLQRSLGDLGDLKRLRDWTKSSMTARHEHLPHRYKREKAAVLADADKAFRRMARAVQN